MSSIKTIKDIDSIHLNIYSKNNRYGVSNNDPELMYDATMHLGQDINNVNYQVEQLQNELDKIENVNEINDINIDIELNLGDMNIDYDELYVFNNVTHQWLSDAISDAINMDMPSVICYFYKFKNTYDDNMVSSMVNTFRELTEIAYNNPYEFQCKDLSDEEQEYIDAILALKVSEKLKK